MTCLAPDDESMNPAAVFAALASAALFGVSTPAAKALLGLVDPVILAGLFYCGAGIGIAVLRALAAPILNAPAARQQPLARPGRHRLVAPDHGGRSHRAVGLVRLSREL